MTRGLLGTIAEEINAAAKDYRMSDFQRIRKEIHGLKRRPTWKIFTTQTIFERKNYAFHFGGREEIQFNIGFEDEQKQWLRYGLAFSLEPSRSLPNPLCLRPKVLKLNRYIQENLSEMEDLRFRYSYNKIRSAPLPVTLIREELIRNHTFLFWGKISHIDTIQPQEVLFLFDRLLHIYEYVEGDAPLRKWPAELNKGFRFKPGHSERKEATIRQSRTIRQDITLKHNKLQGVLTSILAQKYGKENVGEESDTGRGSRVDVVVRDGDSYTYFEIKTSLDIRACLREAVAQLLEYSYWPGGKEAEALVVVSENPLTRDAQRYLSTLRERFQLPLFYQHLDLTNGKLGDRR